MNKVDIINKLIKVKFQPVNNTQMTVPDWSDLYDLLLPTMKQNVRICEIGTNMGFSTALFGLLAHEVNGTIDTIDPYNWKGGEYWIDAFHSNMQQFNLTNITLHRAYSYDIIDSFENETFDIIFIDGDHSYDNIKKDIQLYWTKLKKDGLMCGHDCEIIANSEGTFNIRMIKEWQTRDIIGLHVGVILAVSELFPNVKIQGDRIWWVKK